MDLDRALRELVREWKRIKRAIARLEAQQQRMGLPTEKHRGRKTMEPEERLAVSRRMTEYWRARREQKKKEKVSPSTPSPKNDLT